MSKKLKEKNFLKLDKNKDNKISFEEILPYLTKVMKMIVTKSLENRRLNHALNKAQIGVITYGNELSKVERTIMNDYSYMRIAHKEGFSDDEIKLLENFHN